MVSSVFDHSNKGIIHASASYTVNQHTYVGSQTGQTEHTDDTQIVFMPPNELIKQNEVTSSKQPGQLWIKLKGVCCSKTRQFKTKVKL